MSQQQSVPRLVVGFLDKYAEAGLMILFMGVTSVIIFAQVIARYGFQSSLSWSEEVSRYMFIWLIYLGISYAVKTDRHIRGDILLTSNLLSETGKKILCLIADCIFLGFAIVMAYIGFEVASVVARRGQITASTEIPMWVIYLAVPLGYALCTIRLVQRLRHCIRHFRSSFTVFNRQVPTEEWAAMGTGEGGECK